jgi:hypothetical protein
MLLHMPGTHFAVLIGVGGTLMKTSAICHKCGEIADAEYGAYRHRFDTTDMHGHEPTRVVTIHCPSCGTYNRPPHCQPDLVDAGLLRLLVL